jgi:hypothetical protein
LLVDSDDDDDVQLIPPDQILRFNPTVARNSLVARPDIGALGVDYPAGSSQ